MASDIKIKWGNLESEIPEGDIEFSGGDLTREEGLETAVWMSLFTDRRAEPDDTLPDTLSEDKRGWWGDLLATEDNDQIGSRLWLLSRAKTTDKDLNDAKFYAEECLEWMIDDGVAEKIEVEVERQNRKDGSATLGIKVMIHQSDGNVVQLKYDDLWQNQVN